MANIKPLLSFCVSLFWLKFSWSLDVGDVFVIPILPLLLTYNNDVDPLSICSGAAVVAEPVTVNEPDILASPVYGNAAPAPATYDAVKAYDDDTAWEDVAFNVPIIVCDEPDAISEPVIFTILPLIFSVSLALKEPDVPFDPIYSL